jgi:hypothetical protein
MLAAAACIPATPAGAHGRHGDDRVATHGPDPAPPRVAARARMAAAAEPWCGDERSTDIPGQDDGLARFHAVYALPADAPSRLRQLAPVIQADAASASGVLAERYGRAIRLDRGSSCGPAYLDITTVRLPQTIAALQRLARQPDGTLDAITGGLRRAGFATAELGDPGRARAGRLIDFVVWLDGPYPEASCGQAQLTVDRRRTVENANNGGGKVAAIFRDGDGFCGAATVLHEIGHTLGAVQPKPGESGWTGHCHDAAQDVLCDPGAPSIGGDARTLVDVGNDDYWDPPSGSPLPFWTMNLSRFLCVDASCSPRATGLRTARPARAGARATRA